MEGIESGVDGGRTRVLRIIARLNVGGPAIHAMILMDGLDPARYESLLVTGRPAPAEGDYLALHGGEVSNVVELPALGRDVHPIRDLQAYRQLVRVIRRFRPHVVHTHTAKAGLVGRLAAWRCGVPVIVHTFHGHVLRGYFSRPKELVLIRIERALARVTTRLVAVSDSVRDDLIELGVGRRTQFEVVPLGLDLARFVAAPQHAGELKSSLGLQDDTPTVGIVARLVPIKAHEVFLDMAERVAASLPRVVFLIIGDGERRQQLEALVRDRGLEPRVRFLGWRADLDRVYAGLDVVVLTSRNEGSPVALIEAMASGRPVVATRAGGVAGLVGDAGLLADIDDADALGRAVTRLLTDRELAERLGTRARERVVPAYSKDRLTHDIDALYERLRPPSGQHEDGAPEDR